MIGAAARRVLEDGVLCSLAVRTPHGPHLTPVVYALDGSRIWVTTSRTSVKARAWRADPEVAGLVRSGDATVAFRGRVKTYDALDPLTWPAITFTAPRLVRAAARFSLKNARFFAGYAVDAPRVPLAWTPPGRVFAAVDPTAGWMDTGNETLVASWGDWPSKPVTYRASFGPAAPVQALDLRAPREVRSAIGSYGHGAVGVDSDFRLSVLPAGWVRVAREGSYHVLVATRLLERTAPEPDSPIALTIERASTWRAADMAGMLLQGPAEFFSPRSARRGRQELCRHIERVLEKLDRDPRHAKEFDLIRLRPSRVVWWRGWTSGTVTAR
jgi:hypothetical protein